MKLMYEAGLDQLIKHIKTALNGKEPTFNKNTGFNKNKTDAVENDTNKLFTAKGAYDLKSSVTTAYTNLINSTKTALETSIATKLSHGGYSGTAQSLKTDIDSKLPNPGYGGIHEFGRTIDLHLSGSTADYDTRISSNTDKTLLIQNSNGTLELGPKNATDCHIYTDRAKFYLNKDISISGKLVYHEGNKPTSDDVGAVAKTSISDATNSSSNTTVASSLALKTAYDKAVEGLNRANSVKTELDSKKVDKTINVIAGAGLSGGGSLGNNVTVNLVSADNGILIRENDIKLNLVDDLTTGGVTRGLTAEQGKVLLQMIQALGTGGATKLLRAAEILSDNEYMGILASGGTSIMANTRLYNPILYIDGSRINKGQYTVDLDFGRITLKEPYETIYPEGTVWVIEDQMPHHIDFCFPTMNMLKVSEEIKEKIKVGNVIKILGESDPDDGGHYLVKCSDKAGLNAVQIGVNKYLNEIPNTKISSIKAEVDKNKSDISLKANKYETVHNISLFDIKEDTTYFSFAWVDLASFPNLSNTSLIVKKERHSDYSKHGYLYTVTYYDNGRTLFYKVVGRTVTYLGENLNTTNCPISKAENGWCRLANGLIIQWMFISLNHTTGASSEAGTMSQWTFPTSFTSTNFSISIQSSRGTVLTATAEKSRGGAGFNLRFFKGSWENQVIAIGY